MKRLLFLPLRFLKICWYHGIGVALSLTYELVIKRRFAINVKFPYDEESNSQSWLHLLKYNPLISVVMPVFNSEWLDEAISSVLRQSYKNFELIIADDCSTNKNTLAELEKYKSHSKVRIIRLNQNSGISKATNEAIALAKGEYIAFMDHDDLLHPDALALMVRTINDNPQADIYFSDEVRLDQDGNIVGFTRKCEPTIENLLSYNAITHLCVISKKSLEKLGELNEKYDGAQDHELMLRAFEKRMTFCHLPYLLYGWRLHKSSTSANIRSNFERELLPKAYINGKKAIIDFLMRNNIKATVTDDGFPWYRVKYDLPSPLPQVAIIVPFRDKVEYLERLLTSLKKTTYPHYKIYLVNNSSEREETFKFLENLPPPRYEIVNFAEPFNYSRLHNCVVRQLNNEFLVFMNNDMELITPDWIESLLEHCAREKIGAVGCKLIGKNNKLQHGGISVKPDILKCAFNIIESNEHYTKVQREVAAVSAACMMIRRSVFFEVGGFDEINFPIGFSDVDLCLRIRKAGYKIIYTPFAAFYHKECGSRRKQEEAYEMYTLFKKYYDKKSLLVDKFYSTINKNSDNNL